MTAYMYVRFAVVCVCADKQHFFFFFFFSPLKGSFKLYPNLIILIHGFCVVTEKERKKERNNHKVVS